MQCCYHPAISPHQPYQRQIHLFNFKLFTRPDSVACYHCGASVAVRSVVTMQFDGALRDLCCHGCEAVLILVQANKLTTDYLAEKSRVHASTPITP